MNEGQLLSFILNLFLVLPIAMMRKMMTIMKKMWKMMTMLMPNLNQGGQTLLCQLLWGALCQEVKIIIAIIIFKILYDLKVPPC